MCRREQREKRNKSSAARQNAFTLRVESSLEAKVICFWQYFRIKRWRVVWVEGERVKILFFSRHHTPKKGPRAITSFSLPSLRRSSTSGQNTKTQLWFYAPIHSHIIKLSRNYFFLYLYCAKDETTNASRAVPRRRASLKNCFANVE